MSPTDELLQIAVKDPAFDGQRLLLADALRADGEIDLGDAVEGTSGEELLKSLASLAKRARLNVNVRLLWCAYHVMPRIEPWVGLATGLMTTPWPATSAALPRSEGSYGQQLAAALSDRGLLSRTSAYEPLGQPVRPEDSMLGGGPPRTLGTPIRVREGDAPQPDMSVDQYRGSVGLTYSDETAQRIRAMPLTAIDRRILMDPAAEFDRIHREEAARREITDGDADEGGTD